MAILRVQVFHDALILFLKNVKIGIHIRKTEMQLEIHTPT